MSTQGVRKAAMLLMNLPAGTAAELLRSAKPDMVTRILAELAYLQNHQHSSNASAEPVREFSSLVSKGRSSDTKGELVKTLLETAMGAAKAPEMMRQIQDLLVRKDPFASVRSAPPAALAKAMEGEAPQVVTMVLSELPMAASTQLLNLLAEEVRTAAVQCMVSGIETSPEVKFKVAAMIGERLRPKDGGGGFIETAAPDDARQKQLRKVALLLRSLEKPLRDALMVSVAAQDAEIAKAVNKLMVIWEDVPLVADRALQETLRGIDSRKLALSLVKADPVLITKFRSNMSERAAAMLDEETSLLSSPKPQDIQQSRELILDALRAVNEKGNLTFVEAKA
jgi:flagellar motor switch protein FliG